MIRPGKTYIFDYPIEFVTLPDYSAHRNKPVRVLYLIQDEGEGMLRLWKVQAEDGWTGEAWEDELA